MSRRLSPARGTESRAAAGIDLKRGERFEIRIAGFGGQGIVTIGKILGTAFSVFQDTYSVNTQSYGPESRGGACRSEVVVADEPIRYPYVRRADVLIALSQMSAEIYIADLKEGGILMVDPHAVQEVPKRERYRVYEVPTMEIAHGIGDVKYQNAVALGALYPLIADLIDEDSLTRALSESVPPNTLEINLMAFEKGKGYVKHHCPTG